MNRNAVLHVPGTVADDRRVCDIHAELLQSLGEPRPVAVCHPACEHLSARDDDARPRRHVQVGNWPAFSLCRPAFVIEYPIASLEGGTVLAIPSTNIVTELFPKVIVKCLA